LAINEKSFGPDHSSVALSVNNLGNLLHATNRLGEAEPLMRRALASDEKSFTLSPRAGDRREELRPRASQCGQ
jgi:Tetratricopeptide repeat